MTHARTALVCLIAFAAVCSLCTHVVAQDCGSNMLLIQNSGEYVATPSTSPLEISGALTLECWAQAATNSLSNAAFIEKGSNASTSYAMGIDAAAIFYVRIRTSGGERILQSHAVPNPYLWHHYAAVIVPHDSVYLYLDSVRFDQFPFPYSAVIPATDSLRIGRSLVQSPSTFLGALDEVRVWARAKTVSAILAQMNTVILPQAGLAAYYSFDDESGLTTIHDFSGQRSNAVLFAPSSDIVPSTSPVQSNLPGFKIAAKETAVDFGVRLCDSTFDTIVHVFNRSGNDITLGSMGFASGIAYSVASQSSSVLKRDSGNETSVRVHLSPSQGAVYVDTLVVSSSSVCGGVVRIPFRAEVRTVALVADSARVEFGTLPNCQLPATRKLRIHNRGNEAAHITNDVWNPITDVTLASPSLPIVLPPNSDTDLVFQLAPGSDGAISTELTLYANECAQRLSIAAVANRTSIRLALPDVVTLPTRDASLTSVTFDTIIAVQNIGLVPFYLASSSTLGRGYSVVHAGNGYLKPGDTTLITLRFTSTTCGDFPGTLYIHANQPCQFDTAIQLHTHIGPPTLQADTTDLRLGQTCTTIDTVIRLTNTSSIAVLIRDVAFSPSGAFGLGTWSLPDTVQPNSTIAIPIRFAPTFAGDYITTSRVELAPCGEIPIVLSASAGRKGITVSDTLLGFGRGCDVTEVSRSFNIHNGSSTALTVQSAIIEGAQKYQILSPSLPFTIAQGATQSVEIVYHPTTSGRDDALLTLRADDSCLINRIHLTGSREQPHLILATTKIIFDTTCSGDTAFATLRIDNVGADTVDLTQLRIAGSTEFRIREQTRAIPASDSAILHLAYIPSGQTQSNANLTLTMGPCVRTSQVTLVGTPAPSPVLVLSDSILDFGAVRVGDSVDRCLILSNPSCVAIDVDPASFALPAGCSLTTSTGVIALSRGIPQQVCITYRPTSWDTISRSMAIDTTHVRIHAIGLASEIHLVDSSLDFGYVIVNHSKSLSVHIRNVGNIGDTVTIAHATSPAITSSVSSLAVPLAGSTFIVNFTPTAIGRIVDTIPVSWSNGRSNIIVHAEGVDSGLIANAIDLDFGDVRLGDVATKEIALTATNGYPITVSTPVAQSPFAVSINSQSTNPILRDIDTCWIDATFSPSKEATLSSVLTIPNSSHQILVNVRGRGVEAHAAAAPDTLEFGKVQLGTTADANLIVADTGGYPLIVDSIIPANPVFSSQSFPQLSQLPNTSRTFGISFTPITAKPVTSVARIYSNGADSLISIVLRGRGTYGPASLPDVRYVLPHTEARVGDKLLIPVLLQVQNASTITLDSIAFDVAFDPYMLYVHDITSSATASATLQSTLTRVNDSVVHIAIAGKHIYGNGALILLQAEALLGPHDTSVIGVRNARPEDVTLTSDTNATLVIKDCGGTSTPVTIVAAPSSPSPNPAALLFRINYTLPAAMRVQFRLFDVLGKPALSPIDGAQETGSHQLTIDCSTIAAGKYLYTLKLGEQTTEGSIVVTH